MFTFLSDTFSSLFSRLRTYSHFTEEIIQETLQKVQEGLLEADVPYEAVEQFILEIKKEVVGKKIVSSLKPAEQLIKIVHDKLLFFLGGSVAEGTFSFQIPSIIMMMGLQGSGKTTSAVKLAFFIREMACLRGKKRSILLASVDFNRPAAVEQLKILADKAQVDFYRASSVDVITAAQEIVNYGQKSNYELIILDTAGRMHVDEALLNELKQLDQIIRPKYKILVLDSMTGQQSLAIAKVFDRIGFTGAFLSKVDSDVSSGVAFAFRYVLKKPILFVGTGEKMEDLELFRPERIVNRLLGMGDIASLVEKAQEKIDQSEQKKLTQTLKRGTLTLQDFAEQMHMVSKLGSLSNLMQYLPGGSNFKITPDDLEKGEREMKKFKAIMTSMTQKELMRPEILNNSRIARIARGAGVDVADIKLLLDRFEQSQQFAKVLKKMGNFNHFFK
jgi:signal recognition particle subunit SRP54